MSRAEELPVICAMEEFAKRYPFLAVYSDKNFALFRNCRGPDTRSWMSSDAIMAKTAIPINMLLADLNVGDGPWGNGPIEGNLVRFLPQAEDQSLRRWECKMGCHFGIRPGGIVH